MRFQVQIPEFHLELWPGYQTAIGQYENNILLNAEITYKVLRRDTAYDLFKQCIDRGGDFKVMHPIKSHYFKILVNGNAK